MAGISNTGIEKFMKNETDEDLKIFFKNSHVIRLANKICKFYKNIKNWKST